MQGREYLASFSMQFIATVRDHGTFHDFIIQRKVSCTYTLLHVTVGCYNFMWHMGFLTSVEFDATKHLLSQ